ncbi:MAG: indolepyruvate ferredoxin oxidoreductase family protein [Betaproteobacteria bacterium]|nr:indolepyruvate ferredoxin oxidoreductase family protein [Betaproteobacteria bacterium]
MLNASLEDKYRLARGRVFVTATQALVRLALLQAERDRAAGLSTAGFVSGYRGSPLGGLDRAFMQASEALAEQRVRFQPGVNEELAATACWGTQQLHLFPAPRCDGVFAMWYGKGPGVDRCADVFKHANHAGTARHGGVLVVAGDDHAAKSSAVAHQSEHQFSAAGIPVLAPADIQECLDFGLHGWAMSRFAGLWVALKLSGAIAEGSATVEVDPRRAQPRLPRDSELPADGLNIRLPDSQLAQERRIQEHKVYAALAYARANALDRTVFDSPRARLGIITCGKAYGDVRRALEDLGIGATEAEAIGLRLYKVGLVWPLEAEGVRRFAAGLEEVLVVEEKRQVIEYQLKEQLYNWREDVRPRVIGKFDEQGEWGAQHGKWLLPPTAELTPGVIARVIAARLANFHRSERSARHLELLDEQERALAGRQALLRRAPWFCPGCPHNTSTRVPDGSCALAGVGCHLMATWMDRSTQVISQMGGEGASWIGLAPYSGTRHVFANMGDGTYYHSGLLAIRAAVAAGVNITYKLLYNDAVAMTGGQPVDGPLGVPQLTRQLAAEGVGRIVVVADDVAKYDGVRSLAPGTQVLARAGFDRVQRELREAPGVSVLIYDQLCATEKRRRVVRGALAPAREQVFIHERLCEGCGECAVRSNCLAVVPVETEFGRKRRIDPAACTADLACLAGGCPALLRVRGGTPRALLPQAPPSDALPEPALADARERTYAILVAGIGGSGVVTLGALLGMAAHLEGKGVNVHDMTGLSQKAGAVYSHVRIAQDADRLHGGRIAAGEADVLLGGDLVVALADEALGCVRAGRTRAVVSSTRHVTGEFIARRDLDFPEAAMRRELTRALGENAVDFMDASAAAGALAGDPLKANVLLLGYACQKGLLPVSAAALLRAIELNGVAVEQNRAAFAWGRVAALDPGRVARLIAPAGAEPPAQSLDERIERRARYLTEYQDEAYARRYLALVERARETEAARQPGSSALAEAVADGYFRLLAAKDEYEVARLLTDPGLARDLEAAYEGRLQHVYQLRGRSYGAWIAPFLRLLARMRRLRGSAFDPFARLPGRRLERRLLVEYEQAMAEALDALDARTHALAVELAAQPAAIRGFGPVKAQAAAAAQARRGELLAALRGTPSLARAA